VTGDGIVLNQCAGSVFLGTSEGNHQRGILVDVGAVDNLFLAFDLEANRTGDITLNGANNTFINTTASSRAATSPYESVRSIHVQAGAARNLWLGGSFYAALVDSGAKDNGFLYFDSGFKVDDSGTRTAIYGKQLFITSDAQPWQIPIQDSFATLPTLNSWANTSGTFQPPQYTLNRSSREVILRGEVGSGAAGTVIANLPAGYRPAKTSVFVCPATGSAAVAIVRVNPNGDVVHQGGVTSSITLDQVRFFL
jgi:hypothetical protein